MSICVISVSFFSQNKTIDSLYKELNNSQNDTVKIKLRYTIGEVSYILRVGFWDSLKNDCKTISNTYKQNTVLNRFYLTYMASALNNLGFIEQQKGNIPISLDYHNKSLKIREEIGSKNGIAYSLINIGNIYEGQNDYQKALEYYLKSLLIRESIDDKKGIAYCLINIGNLYETQGNTEMALKYYKKSLNIRKEIADKQGMASSLNNIGYIYENTNNLKLAVEYYKKALNIRLEIYDKKGTANSLNNISSVFLKQKNIKESLNYALQSIKIAKELGFPENMRSASRQLFFIYKTKKDYKNAFKNYELYIQMRDSISNNETRKASVKSQLKYEYEKKAVSDSVHVAEEKKLTTVKLKQEKTQRYFLYGGLGLTALFGVFMFNRFRIINKQKIIIQQQKNLVEHQKEIVDKKQKEILDSIHYAKRIQQSLLPTEKFIERVLKNKII